jgi:hypothetical protein
MAGICGYVFAGRAPPNMKKCVSDINSPSHVQVVRNSEAITFTRLSHHDLFNKILLITCRAVSIVTT